MRLIDADAMYERARSLEAQALDYVGKLIERDGDEVSVEWKIWSAILAERTAFKHDVFDAPTIEERKTGHWINAYPDIEPNPMFMYGICSICGCEQSISNKLKFCPDCGARMERKDDKH